MALVKRFTQFVEPPAEGNAGGIAGAPAVSAIPKIETCGMSFFYGTKQALYDINLKIQDKAVTALIGPSGCGKSTYLRSLNRMNDIIEGTRVAGDVLLDGEDIYARDV